MLYFFFFFFNDTATTEIYTLSLHDALPISRDRAVDQARVQRAQRGVVQAVALEASGLEVLHHHIDRKSTRLNSSHLVISYAVFCLKKKNRKQARAVHMRIPHSNGACGNKRC